MGTDDFVMAKQVEADQLAPLNKITCLFISLTAAAVQSGLLFGYDTGIVSGAMVIIRDQMELNDLWQELIISVTLGAAAISAFLGGYISDRFGRKKVILGTSILFIVGAAVLAFSPDKILLLIGRIILGLAIGASSGTIPPYIAECSPVHIRGRMLVMFQFSMTVGFFIAAITAGLLTYVQNANLGWRIMLGLGSVPALIQLIVFSFMPESPRWLALHGKITEARQAMIRIYGNDELAAQHADVELKAIKTSAEECEREKQRMGAAGQPTLLAMLRTPHLRKALVIECSLQMFQQFSGINTVKLTALTSGVKMLSTFIGIYLVEKIGRRLLLLCSTLGVIFTLSLLGTAFAVIAKQSPDSKIAENMTTSFNDECRYLGCDACSYNANCGFCFEKSSPTTTGACVHIGHKNRWSSYGRCNHNQTDQNIDWNYGYCPSAYSWLLVLGLVLYLCSFASGYAGMPWTINAEIFPNWARSTGNGMSTTVNYMGNLLISLTFLTLARAITRQGAFFLYAGFTSMALIWFYLVVPETKNNSMEEVQHLLKGPWFSRGKPPKDQ